MPNFPLFKREAWGVGTYRGKCSFIMNINEKEWSGSLVNQKMHPRYLGECNCWEQTLINDCPKHPIPMCGGSSHSEGRGLSFPFLLKCRTEGIKTATSTLHLTGSWIGKCALQFPVSHSMEKLGLR